MRLVGSTPVRCSSVQRFSTSIHHVVKSQTAQGYQNRRLLWFPAPRLNKQLLDHHRVGISKVSG